MGWEGGFCFCFVFYRAPGLALLALLLVLRRCSRNLSSCGFCDCAWGCWEALPQPGAPGPAGGRSPQGIEKGHISCLSSGASCSLPKHLCRKKPLGRAEDLLKPCPVGLLGSGAIPEGEGEGTSFP